MSNSSLESADEDSIDIQLRPIEIIVARVVSLITLVRRGAIEGVANSFGDDDELFGAETDRFELYSWARHELSEALTSEETRVLRSKAGSLDAADMGFCTDALVSAEALSWVLGIVEQLSDPALPSAATIELVLAWAPGPWQKLVGITRKVTLLDEESIAQERERRELWFWRSSIHVDDFQSPQEMNGLIRETSLEASTARLVRLSGGDFSYFGSAVANLTFDTRAEIESIASLQLHALNWVCGFGESWASVPLYPD